MAMTAGRRVALTGAEALADLGRTKAAGKVVEIKLPELPAGLPADGVVVAVLDGESLTLRTIRKPPHVHAGEVLNVVDAGLNALTADVENALTAEEARVLESGGFDTSALRADETSPMLQAAAEYRRLLDSSLTVEQAARRLGVNTSRVRQRLIADSPTLYGIKDGARWRVPSFQFGRKKMVPGIGTVIAALPKDVHPVAVYRWLTSPHQDLYADDTEEQAVSPLDWLRMGRSPEVVADLARGL
jgi:hypothetical protein